VVFLPENLKISLPPNPSIDTEEAYVLLNTDSHGEGWPSPIFSLKYQSLLCSALCPFNWMFKIVIVMVLTVAKQLVLVSVVVVVRDVGPVS
jgi:hypothetical protein